MFSLYQKTAKKAIFYLALNSEQHQNLCFTIPFYAPNVEHLPASGGKLELGILRNSYLIAVINFMRFIALDIFRCPCPTG